MGGRVRSSETIDSRAGWRTWLRLHSADHQRRSHRIASTGLMNAAAEEGMEPRQILGVRVNSINAHSFMVAMSDLDY
jgi:hypothetical protein